MLQTQHTNKATHGVLCVLFTKAYTSLTAMTDYLKFLSGVFLI